MNNDIVLSPIPLDQLKMVILETVKEAIEAKENDNAPQPFDHLPELLTRKQTAEILGICLASLDSYVKQGRLIKHRNGNIVRFKKSEVLSSLKSITKYQRG